MPRWFVADRRCARYAMGHNEYSPSKKTGHSAGIFGSTRMGATVIDALDTLLIMGMTDEAGRARDWIATNLNFDVVRSPLARRL